MGVPNPEQVGPDAQPLKRDYSELLRMLDEWLADESGYDEETWPALKKALDANRGPGERKLFRDSAEGLE